MNRSLLMLLGLSFGLFAQAQEDRCGSTLQNHYSQYQDQPEVLKALKLKDQAFNEKLRTQSSDHSLFRMDAAAEDTVVRYIPVVFHILHRDGQHNVSTDQIYDQLETLNEDFRRLNANRNTTPEPFQFTRDSLGFTFSGSDVSTLVGPNKYMVFQQGTEGVNAEDFEFNIQSGNKVVLHFTNNDFGNVPSVTASNGETITYKAIDVEGVTDMEVVMNAVKDALNADFSTYFTATEDTTSTLTDPTLIVVNKQRGNAGSYIEGIGSASIGLAQRMVGRYVAADARIEFVLAKLDPNGNPTTGINRVYSDRAFLANEPSTAISGAVNYNTWRNEPKSVSQWDPTKYFNIWSVENISSPGGGSILGFAQFPTQLSWAPHTDGVILRSDELGSIGTAHAGNLGRTLTHEAGHWLQLLHIWGDDDTRPDGSSINDPVTSADDLVIVSSGSDEVFDTPNQGNRTPNSCPTFKVVGEVNSLHGDMFMNYMDYGDDPCMSLFTFGQVQRMRGALDEFRTHIWSDENLAATGIGPDFDASTLKPGVDLFYNKRHILEGKVIRFTASAVNTDAASTYNWTFTSGTTVLTETGNIANVTFDVPGVYDVKLEVSNANGTTAETKKGLIYVVKDETVDAPVYFNFTNYAEVHGDNPWATPVKLNTNAGWTWTNIGSPNDGAEGGLRISSSDFNESDVQMLKFKPLNTQNLSTGATFTFDYSYVKKTPSTDDRFVVKYKTSKNSAVWIRAFEMSTNPALNNSNQEEGMSINGGDLQYLPFTPVAGDWKTVSFNLPSPFRGKDWVEVEVEYYGRDGNYFYFDNVNISNAPLSTVDSEFEKSFTVYPNPSKGDATIEFTTENNADVQLEVVDLLGKVHGTKSQDFVSGVNKVNVSTIAGDLSNGVYFVKVANNNKVYTKKFVVSK
ncbi:MAG: M43 family zinc metalloprotease [Flavobacteriales bacterium]